ncbi:MAG: SDR family NAD(P)-dependent oxidoreductase [Sphingomonas sp.]|jgi:NAD(P)-dependent dehydrogenase (short-subunit alcohol dehydrogenase family)
MALPYDLTGRTVLIAGASSGLGEGFARLYAMAGAKVVLGARRLPLVEAIAKQIGERGGAALGVTLDVTDAASVAAAFDAAEARFGTIDIVIANAGVAAIGRSTDIAPDLFGAVIDTNIKGVYLACREAARRMIASGSREREDARIIIIGSITAIMGYQGDTAYAASKAAIAHLGRQFAKEWVRQGINVNVVQPGNIETGIDGADFDDDAGKARIASFNRRRLQTSESLDDIMLYLASVRSRSVTGAVFTIDDGQSL